MEIRLLLSRLEQRKALQKKLKLEHVRALESIDAQIRELHEKRARIVIRNREATEALQREITEIAREVKRVHSAQVEKPAAEAPAAEAPATEAPAAETPAVETPAVEALAVEALTAEASKSALQPNPESAAVSEVRAAKLDPADDAVEAIRELLKNRGEMSESLLREKLRAKRVNVGELSKRLDKLVNAGILRRRGSNYSLAKKR